MQFWCKNKHLSSAKWSSPLITEMQLLSSHRHFSPVYSSKFSISDIPWRNILAFLIFVYLQIYLEMKIENSIKPGNHVQFIFPAMVPEHFCWDLVRVKLFASEHRAVLIILLVSSPNLHVRGSGGLYFNFDLVTSHFMELCWLILEVYCKSVLLYGQVRYLAAAGIYWPNFANSTPMSCHVTNNCKLRGNVITLIFGVSWLSFQSKARIWALSSFERIFFSENYPSWPEKHAFEHG